MITFTSGKCLIPAGTIFMNAAIGEFDSYETLNACKELNDIICQDIANMDPVDAEASTLYLWMHIFSNIRNLSIENLRASKPMFEAVFKDTTPVPNIFDMCKIFKILETPAKLYKISLDINSAVEIADKYDDTNPVFTLSIRRMILSKIMAFSTVLADNVDICKTLLNKINQTPDYVKHQQESVGTFVEEPAGIPEEILSIEE